MARCCAKIDHFLCFWKLGSPRSLQTTLRERRGLSTRERNWLCSWSTDQERLHLSWKAENQTSFTFWHIIHTFDKILHHASYRRTRSWQTFVTMCLRWWSDLSLLRYGPWRRRPPLTVVCTVKAGSKGLKQASASSNMAQTLRPCGRVFFFFFVLLYTKYHCLLHVF